VDRTEVGLFEQSLSLKQWGF